MDTSMMPRPLGLLEAGPPTSGYSQLRPLSSFVLPCEEFPIVWALFLPDRLIHVPDGQTTDAHQDVQYVLE
jgi:hypothetical protein